MNACMHECVHAYIQVHVHIGTLGALTCQGPRGGHGGGSCEGGPSPGVLSISLHFEIRRYTHIYTYTYIYIHIHIHIHMYIYRTNCTHTHIYICIHIWVPVYPPPAFCDISKSHELRQFRVRGLGYMSLGFRLPNFQISQIVLAHLGWDYFGNWEIGKYVTVTISQWAEIFWEIGKLESTYLYRFPNFPISQIVLSQMGWGLLGDWEIGKSVPPAISQFPNFPNRAGPFALGLFGKLGNRGSMYPFPNFPTSQIVLAHLGWDYSGNWEIGKYVPVTISQFPK